MIRLSLFLKGFVLNKICRDEFFASARQKTRDRSIAFVRFIGLKPSNNDCYSKYPEAPRISPAGMKVASAGVDPAFFRYACTTS